jgi:hypothetical protein
MYLIGLSIAYCIAYLALFFGISFFFNNRFSRLGIRSVRSIVLIVLLYFGALVASGLVSDPDWSNRILHTFGGGFLIVVAAAMAAVDSGIKLKAFQFIVVALSVGALFGVVNEIVEYILQTHFGFVFTSSVSDTWLDLISNTIGSALAGVLLAPFVKKMN